MSSAQCDQPRAGGCPLEPNQQVSSVLNDPDQAHLWRLGLSQSGTVLLVLTGLRADYRLYVYGPDGSIAGISDNRGTTDETVVILGGQPGEFQVFVDSPLGEVSTAPYLLIASVIDAASAPTSSTITPPVSVRQPARTLGRILLDERFDDPRTGLLPGSSPDPGISAVAYRDGEYVVTKIDPSSPRIASVSVPIRGTDATLEADARLEGDTLGRSIYLACRQPTPFVNYRLQVDPDGRRFRILRGDGPGRINNSLLDWQPSPEINPGNAINRLGLTCVGSTMIAIINGFEVGSVEDATYHQPGGMWIGVYGEGVTAEARFDNLIVAEVEPR